MSSNSRRQLGFWMCLALVIGNVIGSGVFLLPAALAPYGLNSIFGWLLTSGGALLLAVVFARLSRVFPQAGGPYVYPRLAFGECVGFLIAWGYLTSVWVGNSAIAIGTVAYLAELVPAIKTTVGGPVLTSCALVWFLTLLNWRGVRQMGAVQIVTTVLKLLPLVAVIMLSLWLLGTRDVAVVRMEPQPLQVSSIAASAALTLWAFLGLESATVPAQSVIDPERNIPRATLWGTLLAAVVYVLACSTVMLLIPGSELASSNAPFADVVRLFWGENVAGLLALFAFISGFGALNGWILVQGEMPRVLAQEGIFPRLFARESRYGTPGASLFITSGLGTVLVLMNYTSSMVQIFTFIVLVCTSVYLVIYLLCSLAALKLAWQGALGARDRRLFLFMAIAALAATYSLWTLYGAGTREFWWSLTLFAIGLPVYFALKWQQRRALPAVGTTDSVLP